MDIGSLVIVNTGYQRYDGKIVSEVIRVCGVRMYRVETALYADPIRVPEHMIEPRPAEVFHLRRLRLVSDTSPTPAA